MIEKKRLRLYFIRLINALDLGRCGFFSGVFYAFLRSQVHRHHLSFDSFLCYRSNSITIYTDLNWLMASYTHITQCAYGGGGSLFWVCTLFSSLYFAHSYNKNDSYWHKVTKFRSNISPCAGYALFMYILFIFISFHTHSHRDRGGCSRYHLQRNLSIQTAKSF